MIMLLVILQCCYSANMIDFLMSGSVFLFKIYIFLFFSSLYSSLAQQQSAAAALSAHHPFGVQPPHPYQQVFCLHILC